ncbi:hypothetical protein PSP6_230008 [Paraburkholderia tropica]|nr:hypothetical protein PSP6_230008 [Paraburkholderia tropica]
MPAHSPNFLPVHIVIQRHSKPFFHAINKRFAYAVPCQFCRARIYILALLPSFNPVRKKTFKSGFKA